MRVKIEFSTVNAAFEDDPNEVKTVLHRAANIVKVCMQACLINPGCAHDLPLLDTNGNTVGKITVVMDAMDAKDVAKLKEDEG